MSIENQINRRQWNWFGHTLHKQTGAREKPALNWNPNWYWRGRPKRTWQTTIGDETRGKGKTWNDVMGIAGDRNVWKIFMGTLCSNRSYRRKREVEEEEKEKVKEEKRILHGRSDIPDVRRQRFNSTNLMPTLLSPVSILYLDQIKHAKFRKSSQMYKIKKGT